MAAYLHLLFIEQDTVASKHYMAVLVAYTRHTNTGYGMIREMDDIDLDGSPLCQYRGNIWAIGQVGYGVHQQGFCNRGARRSSGETCLYG